MTHFKSFSGFFIYILWSTHTKAKNNMSQIIIIRFSNIDLSLQNWVSVGFNFESIILQRTLCFPFKTKLCFYAVTSTCSAVLYTFMNLLRCIFLWKTLQSSWLMLRADDSVIRSAAQTANRTLNQDFECADTETCKHTQTPWPCDSVCTSDFTWTLSHLIILVPGQTLGGEYKPVLLGASLHDADVINGQPALPDHLRNRQI